MSQINTSHAALISSLDAFYHTVIDLDYLRTDEVQFPPHTGRDRIPLATVPIQLAGLSQEAQQLLHFLPYVIQDDSWLFEGESVITQTSKPVSYLDKGEEEFLYDDRVFGLADGGEEVMLPPWAILILKSSNRDQNIVVYDTRSGKIADLPIYEPTEEEFEAAATSPDALIAPWVLNLRALTWVPWRNDDNLWGMDWLTEGFEAWLADPERLRQESEARTGPTTIFDAEGRVLCVSPSHCSFCFLFLLRVLITYGKRF